MFGLRLYSKMFLFRLFVTVAIFKLKKQPITLLMTKRQKIFQPVKVTVLTPLFKPLSILETVYGLMRVFMFLTEILCIGQVIKHI